MTFQVEVYIRKAIFDQTGFFTADKNIILKKVGKIKQRKFEEVSQIICDLIS